jgi:hypothetical protein
MHIGRGFIRQIRLDALGQTQAWIDCPPSLKPAAGQYILARSAADQDTPLATCLFPSEPGEAGFWAAAPLPVTWLPGAELELRGVLGHGFSSFSGARRIALASLSPDPARLMPFVQAARQQSASLTLFAEPPLPSLPAWLEIYPLGSLPELIHWPDYLAIDLPLESLPRLRSILGLQTETWLPCTVQALIRTAMPCGGMAECSACAVPARRGGKGAYHLACSDGPVFDLNTIDF